MYPFGGIVPCPPNILQINRAANYVKLNMEHNYVYT